MYVLDDAIILLVFKIKLLKSCLLLFLLPSWKRNPADKFCHVTPGDAVKKQINFHSVRHGTRSESKSSDEISSSSDESLSTDAGHLSLKPYMHEPPAKHHRHCEKSKQTMGDYYRRRITHSSAPSDELHCTYTGL